MTKITNNVEYFQSQGFKQHNCNDTDLDQLLYIEYYTKEYVKDQILLDITFVYKVNGDDNKSLRAQSVNICVDGSTTETTITTIANLQLMMSYLSALSTFIK